MKRILVLAESLHINETSAGIVSSTMIQALDETGFELTVLTPANRDYEVTWFHERVELIEFDYEYSFLSILDRVPKLRAVSPVFSGSTIAEHDEIRSWRKAIQKVLATSAFDYIFALGAGGGFRPHLALSQVTLGVPIVLNIHDPFPMDAYPAPYAIPPTSGTKKLRKRLGNVISKADKVVFPSNRLMEDMSKLYGIHSRKAFVLRHFIAELSDVPTSYKGNESAAQKPVLLHMGTLLGPRNPDNLIDALNLLLSENPSLSDKLLLRFVGPVSRNHQRIEAGITGNIEVLDFRVSYAQSLEMIREALGVIVLEAEAEYSPFMPAKLADILKEKKPVLAITPPDSEVRDILGPKYLYTADSRSVSDIAGMLKKFCDDVVNGSVPSELIEELRFSLTSEGQKQTLLEVFN